MPQYDVPKFLPEPKFIRRARAEDLKGLELFEDVDGEAVAEIANESVIRELGAQEPLHTVRGQVDYLYIILSGYVAIWLGPQFANSTGTFLAWRGPQQILGEMKAVAGRQFQTRIEACGECRFVEIRSDHFLDVANSDGQMYRKAGRIYRNVARLLVKKMEDERCRSEIIRMPGADRKVAQTLLHLAAERCNGDDPGAAQEIIIPGIIHQDEIAGYIGVKRETTSRVLSEFKRKHIIAYPKSQKGSQITILDKLELEKIVRS